MSFMRVGKLNQIYYFPLFVFAFSHHSSATVCFKHWTTRVCEAKILP